MTGDYLWDRTGPADADVVQLERLLGRFAWTDAARNLAHVPRLARQSPAFPLILATAACVVLALVTASWRYRPSGEAAWEVTRVTGLPVASSGPIRDSAAVRPGTWLETRADGRVAIAVGQIGQVQLEPDTRVDLLTADPGDYHLQLDRGTMHAMIWSPPGQFSVSTPSATAIDMGCAYTMSVDAQGVGLIRVTSGWVGFGWHGREAFIPEGAVCVTRPGLGPGTPHFDDAPAPFQAALDLIDRGDGSPADRARAIGVVLDEARPRDVLTLWHLLVRAETADRDRVFDRLSSFVPAPAAVTREGIRSGRQDMLDTWWNYLGYGSTNWWRVWEQEWRQNSRGR